MHAVTLADGHAAWLVVRYDEARAALNDPRLSKDMHAALATGGEVVAEGLPGPGVRPAHARASTRPTTHGCAAWSSAAFSVRRIEELRPHVQAIVDDLLDGIAARAAPTPRSTSSRRSRSRCRSR